MSSSVLLGGLVAPEKGLAIISEDSQKFCRGTRERDFCGNATTGALAVLWGGKRELEGISIKNGRKEGREREREGKKKQNLLFLAV